MSSIDHSSQDRAGNPMDGRVRALNFHPTLHSVDTSKERKGNSLTPGFVLRAVHQWWKTAAPLGLLIAAAAGAVVYLRFEPEYRAQAILKISYDYVLFPDNTPPPGEVVATQRELMRTRLVLGPVLANTAHIPEIAEAEDQVAFLGKEIEVRPLGNSQFFTVAYTGKNPGHAAMIVNEVVDSYLNLRRGVDRELAEKIQEKLLDEEKDWQIEITTLRSKVLELEQTTAPRKASADPENSNGAAYPLMDLQNRRIANGVEKAKLMAQIEAWEESIESGNVMVPSRLVEQVIDQQAEVAGIRRDLAALQAKQREIERKSNPNRLPPVHKQLTNLIEHDRIRLEELRESLRGEMEKKIKQQLLAERKDQVDAMKEQVEGIDRSTEHLDAEYERHLNKEVDLTKDQLELELKRAELERAQAIYDKIRMRDIQIETEKDAPEHISRMEDAVAPIVPVERLPYKNLGLAAAAGFCFPFFLAVLWEYRVRRVSDSRQLEEQSSLAVIGEIATFPVRAASAGSRDGRNARTLRLFEESIDSLRTYLVLAQPVKGMRVLAVTSAATREGKTSVASQLAVSIARATGEMTLLIDGDMRKPDVHDIFGINLKPGLTKVLDHEVTLEEAVNTEWSDRVHILPAGDLHTSPHCLLGNGALKALLSEARGKYGYIVIDTPPVLSASESLILAAAADASLMCVMRNYSRVEQIARSYNRLISAGANVVGSVLSGVPAQHYAKTYGDYSYESRS